MTEMELLNFARGPALNVAIGIFLLGVVWRLIEIYTLGRKPDLSEPRPKPGASGWHTVLRRYLVPSGVLARSPINYIGGYVFHVGLALIVFLFVPHILLIESLTGLSWPGLPSPLIGLVTIITLAAMLAVLADRIIRPVKRMLSNFGDYFAWAVTFLPVLTGYMAVEHLLLPYTLMLALHILSVELLLIVFPFTKLMHAFTQFGSRWYNGRVNAQKGVPV